MWSYPYWSNILLAIDWGLKRFNSFITYVILEVSNDYVITY